MIKKNELTAWDLAMIESLVRKELMDAKMSFTSTDLYRESVEKLLSKFEMANAGYTVSRTA